MPDGPIRSLLGLEVTLVFKEPPGRRRVAHCLGVISFWCLPRAVLVRCARCVREGNDRDSRGTVNRRPWFHASLGKRLPKSRTGRRLEMAAFAQERATSASGGTFRPWMWGFSSPRSPILAPKAAFGPPVAPGGPWLAAQTLVGLTLGQASSGTFLGLDWPQAVLGCRTRP